MQRVKKSVEIDAPVQRVFEYASLPTNLPKFWPSMIDVKNVRLDPKGLNEFDWDYKMIGVRLSGHSKTLQSRPNEFVEVKNEGGIPSTFRWNYEARGNKTLLTLDVEYTMPKSVLGRLAETVVAKLNEREAETTLGNLKIACEAEAQATSGAFAPHA